MSAPEREVQSTEDCLEEPFSQRGLKFRIPRTELTGTSTQITEQQKAQQRLLEERFGTKPIRRANDRHEAFINGLEQRQFRRAFQHMIEGTESIEDIKYTLPRASKYLEPLTPEDFLEKLARISEGFASNADVLEVSNHYFLQANLMAGFTIRRFFHEERQSPSVKSYQPYCPDVVDVAIYGQNS